MIPKLAWRNVWHRPLGSALSLGLLALGVGIISLMLLMREQLEQKFQNDLRGVDLVVGAKGSPLQLVLSAVYHLDAPTGNIPLEQAKRIANMPQVGQAIPLSYGDSYRGFRMLGTTPAYLERFDGTCAEGRVFTASMEAVLGAGVAKGTGLKLGDTFHGSHGESAGAAEHDHHDYTVVGILARSNSVLDQLVLTDLASVWTVHDQAHAHVSSSSEWTDLPDSLDITAVLLTFSSRMAMLTLPRAINQESTLQAAMPSLEINRLIGLLGIGTTTLNLVAAGIMIMAGFSVFLALFLRLRDRRIELALLRSAGYRPVELFGLLLAEGMLLALIGFALGMGLSRLGLGLVNRFAAGEFHFHFTGTPLAAEGSLLLATLALGAVAALLPAFMAMRISVSRALSDT